MTKVSFLFVLLFILSHTSHSQEYPKNTFELNVNYGLAGNFQLDYEQPIDQVPAGFVAIKNKKFLGSIGGAEFQWNIKTSKATIGISYDRESHIGVKKYGQYINQNTFVEISDFKLRHINEMFSLFYKRKINKKLIFTAGTFFISPQMQEIEYYYAANVNNSQMDAYLISIQERNASNSNLIDTGIFVGAEYYFYKSGNFQVGIQSRIFHTTSLGWFETVTFTPKLKYTF